MGRLGRFYNFAKPVIPTEVEESHNTANGDLSIPPEYPGFTRDDVSDFINGYQREYFFVKMKTSFVYFLTNKSRTTLYIGVTNDLHRRIQEHISGLGSKFTSKYNCHDLIYFEKFNDINLAIEREKQLKKWNRNKKERLIDTINPDRMTLNLELF